MREKFAQQLEKNKTVTEESFAEMKTKTYHNGDDVKVGDKILFGMILDIDENEQKQISMIMLCEAQIDYYETDDRHVIADTYLPILKLK
jgi:hypothetical protein